VRRFNRKNTVFIFLLSLPFLFSPFTFAQSIAPSSTVIASPTIPVTCITHNLGDANCDNSIDLQDFSKFREEFILFRKDELVISKAASNFNNDLSVDLSDFEIFRKGYIQQLNATPTPTQTGTPTSTVKPSVSLTPLTTPTSTPLKTPTPSSSALFPAQVLNLTNWKETLPTGASESPTEIKQPQLATYKIDPWFIVAPGGNGVRFRAPVNGVTTSGSGYPRSELREMTNNGTANANWSTSSGTHTMILDEAITAVPTIKKHVVAGQIHDANDDVIVIRLENTKLFIDINGADGPVLDANYTLGKRFTVKFVASNGKTMIYYNGSTTAAYTLSKSYSGAYFKAGAYTQSNCSTEGSSSLCNANNYGEVVIYNVEVKHE
jgi:hypothetical protein